MMMREKVSTNNAAAPSLHPFALPPLRFLGFILDLGNEKVPPELSHLEVRVRIGRALIKDR